MFGMGTGVSLSVSTPGIFQLIIKNDSEKNIIIIVDEVDTMLLIQNVSYETAIKDQDLDLLVLVS